MTNLNLPEPWLSAWQNTEGILERFNHQCAQAIQVKVDGEVVYFRLMFPSELSLEVEATLYRTHTTTQKVLLREKLERLANKYPMIQSISIYMLWGGQEGVKFRPLADFVVEGIDIATGKEASP